MSEKCGVMCPSDADEHNQKRQRMSGNNDHGKGRKNTKVRVRVLQWLCSSNNQQCQKYVNQGDNTHKVNLFIVLLDSGTTGDLLFQETGKINPVP